MKYGIGVRWNFKIVKHFKKQSEKCVNKHVQVFYVCEIFRDQMTFVVFCAKKQNQYSKKIFSKPHLDQWFCFYYTKHHKYYVDTKLCTYVDKCHIFVVLFFRFF